MIIDNEKIVLTVIIPFLNSEETLPNTITSIQDALVSIDIREVELLFVDNGSNDRSRLIVDSFCSIAPSARCINEPKVGVSAARNAGLEAARGKYIAHIDSDDNIELNYFFDILDAIRRDPDLVIVPINSHSRNFRKQIIVDISGALNLLSGWWCFQFVFRKKIATGLIFYGDCYEDFGFFPQLMQKCVKIIFLPRDLYIYMDNPGSITRRDATWRLSQLQKVGRKLLAGGVLSDPHIIMRVRRDEIHGRMQLRAISGFWPVLGFKDSVVLISLSHGRRISTSWHLLRLSLSALRRSIVSFTRMEREENE